jgi:hypothetical protein
VVLEAADEVVGDGSDLHEVGRAPRPAQRDGVLAEDPVDVGRDERLAMAALLRLLDHADDRREALCESALVRKIGRGRRGEHERRERSEGPAREAHHARHSRLGDGRSSPGSAVSA